jgi:cyanuric acid amidohydrolase
MPRAKLHRIAAAGPDDVSGIIAAIENGAIEPAGIVAVMGKTEGNGCVNDFSRGFATLTLSQMFARYLPKEKAAQICLVMSGGTEGGMAPHWTIFERSEMTTPTRGPALAIGRAHTPDLPTHDLGSRRQVEMVAKGVRAAMADANIMDGADVHFVQVKCPLITLARANSATAKGFGIATADTLKSMGLSRAASALGVAVALGELSSSAFTDADIATRWELWSGSASCSAGIELLGHEIIVLGMSKGWSGPLAIDHAVMTDAIDVEPVRKALARVGLGAAGQLDQEQRTRLVAVFAKAEASHSGMLRGHRHTMLDDSDISSTRHARAFVCGVLAGLVGHAEIYISGGAEHQGPDGGGPVAVICERH